MRRFLLVALVLASTTPAAAQSGRTSNALRLGLEGNLVAYDKVTLAASGSESSSSAATTNFGIPAAGLDLALGYGVTANVLLGGRLGVSSMHTELGENGTTANNTAFAIVPHVEYIFDGAVVRPFVAVNVGYRWASSSAGGLDTSTGAFLVGPGAGLHAFITPQLSFGASVAAMFQHATAKIGGTELSGEGFTVLASVGISGWFGTPPTECAAATEPPSEVPPQANAVAANTVPVVDSVETSFTLDRPSATGGVQVTIQGQPSHDASKVSVVVSWLRSPEQASPCTAPAFEVATTRTELGDVQAFTRKGFTSSQFTQRGTLPLDALAGLADPSEETRLILCDEHVVVLQAAKRRISRFVQDFRRRTTSDDSAESPPADTSVPGAEPVQDSH